MLEDAAERKATPIYSGVFAYFPDALAEVAKVSKAGNDQHNPGQPLHWDRSKSKDELDALARHLLDAGTFDTDGTRHSAKIAWRALANLQKEIESEAEKAHLEVQLDLAAKAPEAPDEWLDKIYKQMKQHQTQPYETMFEQIEKRPHPPMPVSMADPPPYETTSLDKDWRKAGGPLG